MLVPGTYSRGIGNDAHCVLLIQSDTTNGSVVFADTSRAGNGGAGHAINAGGGTSHSTAQQVFGATSIRFNGAQWLRVADHVDFNPGGGDFTLDMWARPDGVAWYALCGQRDTPITDMGWYLQDFNGTLRGYLSSDGTTLYQTVSAALALAATTWAHVVLQRRNDLLEAFIDGVRCPTDSAVAFVANDSALDVFIGSDASGGLFLSGYIDELRFTKGLARYPYRGFTPPNRMN